jgi:four helix bundle protein
MFQSFEEMPVWKKGMELAQRIHQLTETLPKKEDYGFTSQIRRSSLSVTGNIAEGFGRRHTKDKLNFYYATRDSLAETRSHLIYGQRVGYFTQTEFSLLNKLITEIWKELNSLIRSLHRRTQP